MVWLLMFLLLVLLGVAKTTLTDLGTLCHIYPFLTGMLRFLNYVLSFKQSILLGSWFSIKWREMPTISGAPDNWLQMFLQRLCLSFLIPKRISAQNVAAIPGTWATGMMIVHK